MTDKNTMLQNIVLYLKSNFVFPKSRWFMIDFKDFYQYHRAPQNKKWLKLSSN